jgi:drug/metabolite transporter (DMT)-like permease
MRMLGEVLSIVTSLLWATSTIISAEVLKNLQPIKVNTIKTLFSFLVMIPIALVMGGFSNIYHLDLLGFVYVIVAALIGFGIGDTGLFKSIRLIGVSKSYTIAYTFPLFTMLFAILFLGEPFLLRYVLGTVIIVLGIFTILQKKENKQFEKRLQGYFWAFATAIFWSIGAILIAYGLKSISVILANAIRYPILFIFLYLISQIWSKEWNLSKRTIILLAGAGIFGMTLGGLIYLYSVKLLGISKATTLSSSSPVWAALMSSFFLKEKVTLKMIISILMVVVGIYFLV